MNKLIDKYNYKDTLKNLSYDKVHNKFLINSSFEAFDFDKIKEKWCEDNANVKGIKSVDALIYNKEQCILIEFKSGKTKNLEPYEILEKFYDSVILLSFLTNTTISHIANRTKIFLIHNDKANNFNKDIFQINKLVNKKKNFIFKNVSFLSGKAFDKAASKMM